jgi:hypothetical protein
LNSCEIYHDRTRKLWPFNTGDCLIEVTTWRWQVWLHQYTYGFFLLIYRFLWIFIEIVANQCKTLLLQCKTLLLTHTNVLAGSKVGVDHTYIYLYLYIYVVYTLCYDCVNHLCVDFRFYISYIEYIALIHLFVCCLDT